MTDDFHLDQQLISCRVCGSTEKLRRCSKCKVAFYCSQTHQQSDWRTHKIDCRKYTTNNNLGSTLLYQNHHNQLLTSQMPEHTSYSWPENSKDIDTNNHTTSELPKEGTSETEILSINAEILTPRPQFDHSAKYNIIDQEEQENRRMYRNLAENSMRIGNDSFLSPSISPSEKAHEDLCKHIINDLNIYGLSVIDDFLGKQKGLEILNEVHHMYTAGLFKNGQLVSNVVAEQDLRTIRGDKITWVKGTESGCINIGYLINQVDNVVISANKMKNNGTLGNYKIRERTKAMVACYPGSGSHYVKHVDNPNKDGRVITAIYYLNLNWDCKRSGGILRIFPEHGDTVADIEPKFDRIIFFWSDRRNPHEVQPAHRTRYAITVWYFDAEERELALNRYSRFKQSGI